MWLLRDIHKHREAMNIPIGVRFEEEIEDALCARNPEACGHRHGLFSRVALGLATVLRGTRAIASFKFGSDEIVQDSVAETRASICVNCPARIGFHSPCGSLCQELVQFVASLIGARKTRFDEQLKTSSCSVCKCYISAMIWMPMSALNKSFTQEMRDISPAQCWKLEQSNV